jgi:predicted RNase H-like HicB family nuclease
MRYLVMIRRTATGYSADVPDVPGCVATGRTVEQTRQQMAAALQGHLELLRETGDQIPLPTQRTDFSPEKDADEEFCTWIEANLEEPAASSREK